IRRRRRTRRRGWAPGPLCALHSSVLHHVVRGREVPGVASAVPGAASAPRAPHPYGSPRRACAPRPVGRSSRPAPAGAVTSHNSAASVLGGGTIVGRGPHSGARAHRPPTRRRPRARERFAVIGALQGSPLLALFLVVATGAVLGAITFGRVRLGAAGALFTGLALSAIAPHLGAGMEIVQTLGLALFVYTVGISAGATFFGPLNRQLPLLAAATVSTVLAAALTMVLGHGLGLA